MFEIQTYNSIPSGYFCIAFIEYMLKCKIWLTLQKCFYQATLKRVTRSYIITLSKIFDSNISLE